MARPALSALVVARNEEAQLDDCLRSLAFADERVVVLDRCTDGSRAIAERHAALIVEGAWPLEGERRNAGIDACAGDWIFEVDADERVRPALADEIRAAIAGATDGGYFLIPVDNYVGARLVRHGWGASFGTTAVARLSARGCKRWSAAARVHPPMMLRGPRRLLKTPLQHYVDRDISDMLRRFDRYTTLRALDLIDSGDIGTLGANLRRLAMRFHKYFVSRRGYREGAMGLMVAILAGLYPLVSHIKARTADRGGMAQP